MTKKRVGLIGVGLMGHGIGKNILRHGHPLTVLVHRNRAPVEDLLKAGAKEARSPAEIATGADVVILCVTGSPQVEDIVYRSDGLLAGVHQGLIVADCSTAEPQSTMKVAADIAARGGRFVDTPMTRSAKEAEEGKLGLMTGGDEKVLEEVRPVLSCFADTIVHAGGIGAAHRLKLINNFISLGTAAVVAEGITAAMKANVDMQALSDIVSSGGANSVMFQRIIRFALAGDDTALQFSVKNARKDLRYYTNMTENLPVASFVAETVHQTFLLADNLGYGDGFVPRLVDMMRKLNGLDKA